MFECVCRVCVYMRVGYAQLEKSNQKQQNEAKKENKKPQTQFVCLLVVFYA